MARVRSLSRKSDFKKVYEEGEKRVGRFLVLYFLPGADDARAVIASRKLGGAVQRNRAKRLLREALASPAIGGPGSKERILGKFFPARDGEEASKDKMRGLWVVAIARRGILAAKSADVSSEVEQLLE